MIVIEPVISIFAPGTSKDIVQNYNGTNIEIICTSCTTEEEGGSTGNYLLDAEFTIDSDGLYKNLVEFAILKVRIDEQYEYFVLSKPNIETNNIIITALHITITEQKQLWIEDSRPTGATGNSALNQVYAASKGVKEIAFYSNINTTSTAYYQLMNMYKALYDCEQSFVNRWGGETERRGYNVSILNKRGSVSNLVIREGKNLTGFKKTTNIDDFCTRAIGKAYNGIKGDYIESSLINNYARVNTRVIEYDSIRLREQGEDDQDGYIYFDTLAEVKAEINRRVQLEFSENHIDEIKAIYNISFEQLSNTEEYKEYSYLEKASVGDTVRVHVDSLDIDISVRVAKKKYNVMLQETIEMTLSNTAINTIVSTANIIRDLKNEYLKTGNDTINTYLTNLINGGMANSNVIIRQNEILIMDTKDINTASNVWRWNVNGLAHSNSGYYSNQWNVGITQGGEIIADMMTTGLLRSKNNVTTFNLDNGELNCKRGRIGSNNTYIDINNNKIVSKGVYGGEQYELNIRGGVMDSTQPMRIQNSIPGADRDSSILFSWNPYNLKAGITLFSSTINLMADRIDLFTKETKIGYNDDCSTEINGNLTVTGNKNCIQNTKNYGDRLFYSIEDTDSYLTYTEDKLQVVNNKALKVTIDEIYKECVNLNINYIVEIYKYSFGDYRIAEQTEDYFMLESDKENFEFKYTIKAKRRGFEDKHIDEYIRKGDVDGTNEYNFK